MHLASFSPAALMHPASFSHAGSNASAPMRAFPHASPRAHNGTQSTPAQPGKLRATPANRRDDHTGKRSDPSGGCRQHQRQWPCRLGHLNHTMQAWPREAAAAPHGTTPALPATPRGWTAGLANGASVPRLDLLQRRRSSQHLSLPKGKPRASMAQRRTVRALVPS